MTASPRPFRTDRLLGASVWRMTFLLVQGGGSVALAAALGHILDARAFAITSLVQGVLVIAQAIGDFGLAQATVTVLPAWIARSPSSTAELMAGAARAYLCAAAAAFGLTLASVVLVPGAGRIPILVCAPAAAATVIVAGADGLLRSRGRFRRPVVLVLSSEVGGFAGIPVALATHSATWTCVAVSLGTVVGSVGALKTLGRHLTDSQVPSNASARQGHAVAGGWTRALLRAAAPLGVAQVFIVLGARFDTLLAASLTGLLAAGTFEGAWRVYQLGQYAAGALATAAAPFIATSIGSGDGSRTYALLRQLLLRLLAVGLLAGATLYLARRPLSHALAGSLASPVSHGLVFLAATSPFAATGMAAFYTLIALEDERRLVLGCFALGAVVNVALCIALGGSLGAHGILIGCSAGTAATGVLLISRLVMLLGTLRRATPATVVESQSAR